MYQHLKLYNMTPCEFNKKYIDFLEERYYGLAIPNPKVIEYLDELFENELTKIPGFKYFQIKEKFGYVRFYTTITDRKKVEEIETKLNELLNNKL